MQKRYFYGFNLILLTVLIVTSCKKDSLQNPQSLKNPTTVQAAKVIVSEQNKTAGDNSNLYVIPQVKPDPQPQPWKFMDPQPQPWIIANP